MAVEDGRDTKQRILDAAEKLFSEQGFGATSMRNVTTAAGVNLAAVHYHFGSKVGLVEAVLSRRIDPLNRERLELLEALGESPTIEQIVEAFVAPAMRMGSDPEQGGPVFLRLFGHAISQPHDTIRELFVDQFRPVAFRFVEALQQVMPDLPRGEIFWRLLFMVGSLAHTMAMTHDAYRISGGLCNPADTEAAIRRLVPFVAAGMRTPAPAEPLPSSVAARADREAGS